MRKWSFLTNHAIVLIQIARQPGSTFRQIASAAGISYRALRKAINDLDKDRCINIAEMHLPKEVNYV